MNETMLENAQSMDIVYKQGYQAGRVSAARDFIDDSSGYVVGCNCADICRKIIKEGEK